MAKIDIEISHPVAAVITLVAVIGAVIGVDYATGWHASAAEGMGGSSPQEIVRDAEEEAQVLRQRQAILQKREEILRFQLDMLQKERRLKGPTIAPELEEEIRRSEQMILDLIRDQEEAEAKILLTLKQIWDAEGRAVAISRSAGRGQVRIQWPIEPELGISAYFDDPGYEEVFGMPHKALDIPAEQGTLVAAAAAGTVEDIVDNGLGFNSITIRHEGFATLYGHVESFLVTEGQTVRAGDPIALSGGRPGTPGAGHLSTGPHVHFEVIVDGERVDPMQYLVTK